MPLSDWANPRCDQVFENAKDVAHQSGNVRSEITALIVLGPYAAQRFSKAADSTNNHFNTKKPETDWAKQESWIV
jgi:hypothetical protein